VSRSPAYASVVLDVDSTLCGIEGIDWLARRRGPEIARRIAELTGHAMDGSVALETVYGERLAIIRPPLSDIAALSAEYVRTLAPGAEQAIRRLGDAGVEVILVSGGIRRAIEPVALQVGVVKDNLFAVELRWDVDGQYAGFDTESPLVSQRGKLDVVRKLSLERPILAVGDGATDLAMRAGVDGFAAYTGFVARPAVVQESDFTVNSYAELQRRVLG